MSLGRRPLLVQAIPFVLILVVSLIVPSLTFGAPSCPSCYTWKPLRVGAGGWVTGLDISSDGATRVVRTDTYGAYVSQGTEWRQLVTASSMPAEDVGVEKGAGVFEIRVAPSDASRLYMSYRGQVYRSDDRGSHWARTAFGSVNMDANDDYRMLGQKMAVDPANSDVIYVGTPGDGLFVTTNGGSSWQLVGAVPAGSQAGFTGIAFDPTSGTSGGRTNVVYAPSYGNGVWRTTDAGLSWAQLSGGPSRVKHAAVHTDGSYYATSDSPSEVWRYSAGWQDITPSVQNRGWHSVMPDPFDANRIVLAGGGGYMTYSHDRGVSWSNIVWDVTREATDIPWLAWTQEGYMSNGDMRFDPVTPNRVWFAQGIGVWTTTLPANPSSITWTSQSLGIEQLVANDIAAPPGGQPVLAAWDRPLFYVDDPDVFPTQHGPNKNHSINMGWAVDYASTDPSFLAAIVDWWGVEESCYSTDGGQTWTRFPTMPPWSNPGMGTLAVSTPDNIVWIPSNRKAPYYTKDRGQTWQPVNLPGVDLSKLHWAYYLNRHIVAADRVDIGTFYVHSTQGLYRSTNGGASWTLVHSGEVAPFSTFNALLRTVPGHAGHLFFTSGHQSGETPSGSFVRSTDGGATWTTVPNVLEAYAFGFGKSAPGSDYPTIFITGWVGGVYGIWQSDDEGQSWTQIGEWPLGSLDHVKTVAGDKNTYGTVYIGFSGSGFAYGAIDAGSDADLSLTASASPNPVAHAGQLTFTLTTENTSTATASSVTLNNTLPAGTSFVGYGSTGTCTHSAGTVTCDLGTLAGGANNTVTITAVANVAGTLVNQASVTASTPDPDTSNNSASTSTTVLPAISITDASALEGDSGTASLSLIVSLSAASPSTVTVGYATADGTASVGTDYVAMSGTLSFSPGTIQQTISVAVNGDTSVEPDETFVVNLSNPSGALLVRGQGQATIVNDDAAPPAPLSTPYDFNGDAKPDILWRHELTGEPYVWLMDGAIRIDESYVDAPAFPDAEWQIRGVADFDDDGHVDILWHNPGSGALSVWSMDGTTQIGELAPSPSVVGTRWHIRGVADFNGDGKPDILWRHEEGSVYAWFMDGVSLVSGSYLNPGYVMPSWQIRGTGDFNADGKPDILWQHDTGSLYVWFMDGSALVSGSYLNPSLVSDPDWEIARLADVNDDGYADILWHDQTDGTLYIWYMVGTEMSSGTYLTPSQLPDPLWRVAPTSATTWTAAGLGKFGSGESGENEVAFTVQLRATPPETVRRDFITNSEQSSFEERSAGRRD